MIYEPQNQKKKNYSYKNKGNDLRIESKINDFHQRMNAFDRSD
jgi:hypothetical protein